jgi:copper chaperone CopZ
MTTTRRFKTNLNCGNCVAAVKPLLDAEPSVARWTVDTASPDKVLTVEGDADSEAVRRIVSQAGFKVLGEVDAPVTRAADPVEDDRPTTYYPLALLVAYLLGVTALVEIRVGVFDWMRAMGTFMGGFFLAFSFFKLLDLRGFADAYGSYDLVARRWAGWGYIYPFVELLLGATYVTGFQPMLTNLATLIVMTVGAAGVLKSLLGGQKIRCACLGTVFNLPMTTVTLAEDGLMAVMAAAMLLVGRG